MPDKSKTSTILISVDGTVIAWSCPLGEAHAGLSLGMPLSDFVARCGWPERIAEGVLNSDGCTYVVAADGTVYKAVVSNVFEGSRRFGCVLTVFEGDGFGACVADLDDKNLQCDELRQCIDIGSDGFCVMDRDTKILFVNKVYEEITGLKRESIIGRTMFGLVQDKVFNKSVTEEILRTRKASTMNLVLKNGKSLLVSGKPLFDADHEIYRMVCSVRDVSELVRLQRKIEDMSSLGVPTYHRNFVFQSQEIKRIIELVLRIKDADSTILIQGESGVGKEVIADFVRENSLRRNESFMKINCGAIPEQLLESELFGYTRGAFTGALREGKMGLFEAAAGGTVLLDEVGELPKALQVKLLRVLQDGKIRRIGDTVDRSVDVRIIAATNRNLEELVKSGEFREDLYYRLNVVPITIPPLRKRKDDIYPLVDFFMQKFNRKYRKTKTIESRLLRMFLKYPWRGNVRELENVIERIYVTTDRQVITVDDISADMISEGMFLDDESISGKSLKELTCEFEKKIIEQYLLRYKTTRAIADALQINQSNITRKMQKYHILPDDVRNVESSAVRNG